MSRPNIIVFMTDDQGYGDLGCHGNPILKTPNLDRLYAESVRFTDFHVSPFCTPTRAALFSCRFQQRSGNDDLPEGAFYMVGNIEDVKAKAAEMAI